MSDLRALLAVGTGGALGTVTRYEIVRHAGRTGGFPWAVLGANAAGALLLGVVATLVLERWPPTRYVRPLVGIGFCGGLTTFSAWMVDTAVLFKDGDGGTAALYVVVSLVVGLVVMYAGVVAARATGPRGHQLRASERQRGSG